jgi:transposase
MRSTDGRKLSHKTLEELRMRAVQQVEAGESPEGVIRALGMSRGRIYEWIAKYREGGLDALRAKPVPGRPPKLAGKQIRWLYNAVTTKNPEQFEFPFALWTRAMVRELIRRRFGVRLSEVSVGRLLAKMGLSVQKPLRRAYQQDASLVEQWLETDYPRIQAAARAANAIIYFEDEAGVRSDFHSGTTWAPIGRTPVVRTTGARFGLNLVSAVSAKGKMRFMICPQRFTASVFCEFLRRLMYDERRNIFLVVDGHPTHRARKVQKFVEATKGRLQLFFLPPYSPELNPDELVWNNLKNHGIGKRIITGATQLKNLVISHMRALQRAPHKIRAMFREPNVRYAAAHVR